MFWQILMLVCLTSLRLCTPVLAHSPYYTQQENILSPNGQQATIKLLHGDGIFFADPARAVVVDSNGRVLAVSPKATSPTLHCVHLNQTQSCKVYDPLSGSLYEPVKSEWKTGPIIEEDGKPKIYPEHIATNIKLRNSVHIDHEFGFTSRMASTTEILQFETLRILRHPILTIIGIVWWTIIWSIVIAPLWRLKENFRTFSRKSALRFFIWAFVTWLLRAVAVLSMLFATIWSYMILPSSVYSLAFVIILGVFIATFMTKLRIWRIPKNILGPTVTR